MSVSNAVMICGSTFNFFFGVDSKSAYYTSRGHAVKVKVKVKVRVMVRARN